MKFCSWQHFDLKSSYHAKLRLNHAKMRLCRVPFFWHSAKMYFVECYFLVHDKMRLCRVSFFWHSAKMYFAECLCFGTRQRDILPCVFFLALGKSVFRSKFGGPKWIQMKNFSTTKLYNFSRSIKFILVISSFDKATITLFIKSTSLISLLLVLWK